MATARDGHPRRLARARDERLHALERSWCVRRRHLPPVEIPRRHLGQTVICSTTTIAGLSPAVPKYLLRHVSYFVNMKRLYSCRVD